MSEQPEHDLDGYLDLDLGVVDVRLGGPGGSRDATEDAVELIRRLIRFLPNDDPRKPKREWVEAIRECAGFRATLGRFDGRAVESDQVDEEHRAGATLQAAADWLESLLPPEEARLNEQPIVSF